MNNPETRMAAHVARRDAAHPKTPQTVRGMVLVGVQITLPIMTSNFPHDIWQTGHWGAPLSAFMEAKGLAR